MSLLRNLLQYECSCDEGCVYYVCAGLTWLKVQEGGNKAMAAHVRPIKWLANALAYRFIPIRNKFLLSYLMKVYYTFKSTRVSHSFTHAWMVRNITKWFYTKDTNKFEALHTYNRSIGLPASDRLANSYRHPMRSLDLSPITPSL